MKTIKHPMPEDKKEKCPFCDHENDWSQGTANLCKHVYKVTADNVVFYVIETPTPEVTEPRQPSGRSLYEQIFGATK